MIKEEIERAAKDGDGETMREFEGEMKRMQKEIWRLEKDVERLASDYKRERGKLEAQIEARARQKVDRIAATYQPQINELRNRLQVQRRLREGSSVTGRENQ